MRHQGPGNPRLLRRLWAWARLGARRAVAFCVAATIPGMLTLSGCERTDAPAASAPRPNIILIMIDTLRADRLGCYGRTGDPSPAIDALGAEGVVFDQAYSPAPWTLPSIASLFVSTYPSVHGVNEYEPGSEILARDQGEVRSLSDEFATLAERLQQAGYQTAGFVGNPFIIEKHGFAQGFDHFDASFSARTMPGSIINAAAVEWLRSAYDDGRPLFLYLHYMDVHGPFHVSAEIIDPLLEELERRPQKRKLTAAERSAERFFFRSSARLYRGQTNHERLNGFAEYYGALYDGVVREVDRHIAALRAELITLGIWDQAFVILTADHGEGLGEHRVWTHGRSAHQNQIHIPLMLRWPGVLPAGQRVAQTGRLIDIMPTVLEQLHLPAPAGAQGASLVRLINAADQPPRIAFVEAVKKDPSQRAIVQGPWKLLVSDVPQRSGLFNLVDDPGEMHDLAAQQPERVAALKRQLDEQMQCNHERAQEVVAQPAAPLTEQERRRLEALGYVGGATYEDEEAPASDGP